MNTGTARLGIRGGGASLYFWTTGVDGKGYSYYANDPLMLTAGAWHHVAATYDGAMMRAYLDGEEVGRGMQAQMAIKDSDQPFRIGANYQGAVDEVMLYDRALTKEEVEALATATGAELAQ
jgi:hypothetical protein